MKRFATTLLAVLTFSITNVSPAQAAKINVFSGVSPVFAPAFIADFKGYFKEEGLDVTLRTFQSGAAASEAFRTGGAQFLVTCDQPMLMIASGGDSVIVTQFSENDHMLIVVGHKDMKGPADLKDKKVGLFRKSSSEYMLGEYMKSGGLSVGDIEMVHLAPFDQVPALARGNVDALATWKPFDLKVIALNEDLKILADTGDLGYALYCGMLATRKFLESDEGDMDKFMRAIKKGSDWLTNSKPEEVYQAIADYTKLPAGNVEHTVKGQGWGMVNDAKFRDQMKKLEMFLLDLKLIKNEIDWMSATDWSYIKKLDPKLYQ